MTTTVGEVMTPGVESATPSQALRDAARMMKAGDFGSMPVVDDGRLVGMLTDRDIVVRAVAEGLDGNTARVGDVASRDPVMATPDQDLDEALELMARHRVRRLPVVEDGMLVGVLSQADIALEAKEKKTGEVVQEISQPSSTPREVG
jgi:CBS domain-containing protein